MNKIHVISAGRNAGKFITYCIDSVQRQTLQPDSHTVIDDISDDTLKLFTTPNDNID